MALVERFAGGGDIDGLGVGVEDLPVAHFEEIKSGWINGVVGRQERKMSFRDGVKEVKRWMKQEVRNRFMDVSTPTLSWS